MPRATFALLFLGLMISSGHAEPPVLLDGQFRLPRGFHIYKVADAKLTGGTYDITFDGDGRLLVGDGKAVRRLKDVDGDQVYDESEVIAEGLGGRGPQGLLVYGDLLFAVGGDGIQRFSGYESGGPLKHEGRIGQPFNTGGDHTAHTVLRGLDGYVYFVCGDGGGVSDRKHITEENSPVMYERNASVFRFDPDGEYWECISAGGRNPPSLGMNYLGEFFSFDSDMEWHVDLPWYRPVRLNHWAIGGDQGWQGVGAYPPYYIDSVPPVLEVGRGSPNWGTFYEHDHLPRKYVDAFLCCDYRWKSATTGGYNSSGRLVAFHLKRDGATWKAEMETLAEAIPDAKDQNENSINFALVDVDVAPDGSLFVSDHNQGVWRIFYSDDESNVPAIVPDSVPGPRKLAATQAGSEWSRKKLAEHLEQAGGIDSDRVRRQIQNLVINGSSLRGRHVALRVIAPQFKALSTEFLEQLASDREPEMRAQAAWLYGIRRLESEVVPLLKLLGDDDPFVRRRAAEALGRHGRASANEALVGKLDDEVRAVRYAAMTALAHRPTKEWLPLIAKSESSQIRMRGLVATTIRRDRPNASAAKPILASLIEQFATSTEVFPKTGHLDFLRVLGLFRNEVQQASLQPRVHKLIAEGVRADWDADIAWEYARLAGEYGTGPAIDPLLNLLHSESTENVRRFHIAEALSRIGTNTDEEAWTPEQSGRFFDWLVTTQSGWFAEFNTKGRQFPQFWASVLDRAVDAHPDQSLVIVDRLKPGSQLASMAYGVLAQNDAGRSELTILLKKVAGKDRAALLDSIARHKTDSSLWPDLAAHLFARQGGGLAEWIVKQGASSDAHAKSFATIQDGDLKGEQLVAHRMISQLSNRRDARSAAQALETLFAGDVSDRDYRNESNRIAAAERWQPWYRDRYGVPFLNNLAQKEQLTDERLHTLLSSSTSNGDAARGRSVYLEANCFSCHGGIADRKTAVFGPDLAGVTKRLKPEEIADSIVYPSKQVSERFRNTTVVNADGDVITGVLTAKDKVQIVLVNKDNEVSRIRLEDIEEMAQLETSPMPDKILNRFSERQVQDLLAFLLSLK